MGSFQSLLYILKWFYGFGEDSEGIRGKNRFFLSDEFSVPQINTFMPEKIAFYAGSPTAQQEEMAEKLIKLMENVDEVLSAKGRFLNMTRE